MSGLLAHEHAAAAFMCLGVALRLLYILAFHPAPQSDFEWYYQRAIGILAGQGFSVNGVPTAYWPVGYAGFLSLLFRVTGASVTAGLLANVALQGAMLALYYWIARALTGSLAASRLALLVLAVYPNSIAYCSLLASENLCLPLMLAGIAAILAFHRSSRWGWLVPAGIAFGLATLTRVQFVFVPAVALVALLGVRSNPRTLLGALALVYALLGLTLAPWVARNYRVYGDFVLVSNNGGIVLMLGSNPSATGTYTGSGPVAEILRAPIDEHQRDRRARAFAMDYMATHPLRVISLWPKKLFYLYDSDIEGLRWSLVSVPGIGVRMAGVLRVVRWGHQLVYMGLLALFAVSMVVFARLRRPPQFFLGAWLVAYSAAMGLLFFGDPRYHFQDTPWIVMYAAALVSWTLFERPGQAGRG